MRPFCLLAGALVVLVTTSSLAQAQTVPPTMTFTARLDAGGVPLSGVHDFDFGLWNTPSGGNMIWGESHDSIDVQGGLLDVELGSPGVLGITFTGPTIYLEITVDGTVLSPRTEITTVPYAQRAATAANAELLGGQLPTTYQYAAGNGLQLVSNVLSIKLLGVLTGMLADGAVTLAKLAANSVDSSKIVNGSVALVDLAPDSVDSTKIVDGSIGFFDIGADSVNSFRIVNGGIDTVDLADGSVTTAKIGFNQIDASLIKDNAVQNSEILNGAVTNTKLATDSVTSIKIDDLTITSADLAANAVGTDQLGVPAARGNATGTTTGMNNFRFVYPLAAVATTSVPMQCMVTANVQFAAQVGGDHNLAVSLRTNGGVSNPQTGSFVNFERSTSSTTVAATTSGVFILAANVSVEFGCALSSNLAAGSSFTCTVSYVCF